MLAPDLALGEVEERFGDVLLVESPTPALDNIAAATKATEAAWSRGDIAMQP